MMGEVVGFPPSEEATHRANVRSYRQWRRMNEEKYQTFRKELIETIDSEGCIGTILVTIGEDGNTTVQCDINEYAAVEQLGRAIELLANDDDDDEA